MQREFLKDVKRVVVKVGTNSIVKENGQVDYRQIDRIAYTCSSMMQEGYEVILVTSGAVAVGASMMRVDKYPQTIPEKQAFSSIGQQSLMTLYAHSFQHYNQNVGQILFTRDVIDFPKSKENMINALNALIEMGVIPIINENDAVAVEEINHITKLGDNDNLSALVARLIDADLLVIMSDVDGLYNKNPHEFEDAELIDHIGKINDDIYRMATGKGSEFSSGGMTTKLQAAEIMMSYDSSMIVANSEDPTILFEILKGNHIGTLFKKGE